MCYPNTSLGLDRPHHLILKIAIIHIINTLPSEKNVPHLLQNAAEEPRIRMYEHRENFTF